MESVNPHRPTFYVEGPPPSVSVLQTLAAGEVLNSLKLRVRENDSREHGPSCMIRVLRISGLGFRVWGFGWRKLAKRLRRIGGKG